jgi:surface polysaccharide O-acyltransferase-like enzyme
MQEKNTQWLHNLRVISTISVIIIHVCQPINAKINLSYWWISNVYESLSRFCVPAFVMMSGVLLLGKSISLKDFLSKRLFRILLPFIFWSVVYLLFNRLYLSPSVLKEFLKGTSFHFWYVYMIMGLYLFIPILSPWVRQSSDKHLRYFLLLWFITLCFAFFPAEYYFPTMDLPYFSGYVGYLILGYYLNRLEINQKKAVVIGLLLSIIGFSITYFCTAWVSAQQQEFTHRFYNYCTPNVAILSAGVFLFVKNIQLGNRVSLLFTKIANYTYGMYLVHILVILHLQSRYQMHSEWKNPLMGIPLTTALCFGVSFLIIRLLHLIPTGRYWAG